MGATEISVVHQVFGAGPRRSSLNHPGMGQGRAEKDSPGQTSPVGTCLTVGFVSVTSQGELHQHGWWFQWPGPIWDGHRPLSSHDKGATQKRHKIGLPLASIYDGKMTLEHRGEGERARLGSKH